MEELTQLIKMPVSLIAFKEMFCSNDCDGTCVQYGSNHVKSKVLSLIQVWGIASKGNSALSYISDTYTLLRAEGYTFPQVTDKIDSTLFETAVVRRLHYAHSLLGLILANRHPNGQIQPAVRDAEPHSP